MDRLVPAAHASKYLHPAHLWHKMLQACRSDRHPKVIACRLFHATPAVAAPHLLSVAFCWRDTKLKPPRGAAVRAHHHRRCLAGLLVYQPLSAFSWPAGCASRMRISCRLDTFVDEHFLGVGAFQPAKLDRTAVFDSLPVIARLQLRADGLATKHQRTVDL